MFTKFEWNGTEIDIFCFTSFYPEIYLYKNWKRMKNKQIYVDLVYSIFNICIIIKKPWGVW